MKKILIVTLCVGLLSCQHTASKQDALEVNFPTGTEGFVEVTFGVEGERCDTLPIVDGRLVMENDSLPVTVTLKYLKERNADSKVWLAVQGEYARWGSIPLGHGRTVITFDSLTSLVSVGSIADEYGDFEANDVFFNAPQRFRNQDFLKAHSQSLQALHLLSKSWNADTLQMALDCFSESLRASERGQELQLLISSRKEKGGVAKLFPMWDTAGKAHSFEECLGGKEYMLLNLWASWCGPCRAEIPDLIAYYKECGDRVSFVSVTIDEDRSAWLKAVEDVPKYEWANLSYKFDGTTEGRPRPALFNNGFVPFFYILDHEGNTIYSSIEQKNKDKPLDDAKRRLNELLNN
ncbi:MAG: TlpA family protein disulfide reductase [Bacteroidaceae bacterium]|nr:TlpA family protein disulfide reductase [Bacteroidaceae bacterium]